MMGERTGKFGVLVVKTPFDPDRTRCHGVSSPHTFPIVGYGGVDTQLVSPRLESVFTSCAPFSPVKWGMVPPTHHIRGTSYLLKLASNERVKVCVMDKMVKDEFSVHRSKKCPGGV
jgi:hypothetical protein